MSSLILIITSHMFVTKPLSRSMLWYRLIPHPHLHPHPNPRTSYCIFLMNASILWVFQWSQWRKSKMVNACKMNVCKMILKCNCISASLSWISLFHCKWTVGRIRFIPYSLFTYIFAHLKCFTFTSCIVYSSHISIGLFLLHPMS